jgi:hypothetical protein
MIMSKLKKVLVATALLSLASCSRSILSVRQQWVDSRYLASTHVGTPDPRQEHPPFGQQLVIYWWVPNHVLEKNPELDLSVIFWNFTQKKITFPIHSNSGYKVYSLLDEEFQDTGGLLTYKAEINTPGETQPFGEWKHQLWVNLIELDEKPIQPKVEIEDVEESETEVINDDDDERYELDEEYYGGVTPTPENLGEIAQMSEEESRESAVSINSSVDAQSKQGSVIETPNLSESSPSESD